MPKRTTEVTIGDDTFTVPALNLVKLERVSDLYTSIPDKSDDPVKEQERVKAMSQLPYKLLRIAMDGVCEDINDLQPRSFDEVQTAVTKILEMSGLQQQQANPPQAAAQPAAA